MFLGIEIGGTKLQLGVGGGDGPPLVALERLDVDRTAGAYGIREQIREVGGALIRRHDVRAVGIGFGGPVDAATGRTIRSHQIDGWDDFPLVEWTRQAFSLPVALGNDSDMAGLAEARFGAGRGKRVVFYTNVGSGVGGALVLDGNLHHGSVGVCAELGHMRPGLQSEEPDQTVEAIASGWGIAAAAQARLSDPVSHPLGPLVSGGRPHGAESIRRRLIQREEADEQAAADLLERCGGQAAHLTARHVVEAAGAGNRIAEEVLRHAVQTFGWAVAQMITLVAPEVVVVGGGVPQAGEVLFFAPLRHDVDRYVFPPLRGTFAIIPAALGEEVVVYGALALAGEAG